MAAETSRDEDGTVQTLRRGLEVLRAFRSEPKPVSNKTLAERTGLPKPTITRITHTLVTLGYLDRVPASGQFRLGARTLGPGRAFLESSEVRQAARLPMQQLARRLDVQVGLAVPDRDHMLYLLWYRSPRTMTLRLRPGSLLPVAPTAVGKAYLWALPAEQRRGALAQIRKEHGAKAIDSIQRAFADLDADGYCVSIGEFQKNTFDLAVPLVFGEDRRIMALSCGGARLDLSEAALRQRLGPEILMTADLIRHALGEPDDGADRRPA